MRELKLFALAVISLHLLSGCLTDCDDHIHRRLTDSELSLIPYKQNDTIEFINLKNDSIYQFYCINNVIKQQDTSYQDDYYCKEGGYLSVISGIKKTFTSNIDELENENVRLEIRLGPYDDNNSRLQFHFSNGISDFLDVKYDLVNERLAPNDYRENPNKTLFYEDKIINDVNYNNVNLIVLQQQYETHQIEIDSLYYNSKYGILKAVSKMHNLELVYSKNK